MPDYRIHFPKKFLAAHDLQGKDVALTIKRCIGEELESDKGKERKLIFYFEETHAAAKKKSSEEKRLVMNITNARTIAAMHGNEMDDWIGKRITLFPTQCQSFGETVDCIRVREEIPA